jgi:hypothetical protein
VKQSTSFSDAPDEGHASAADDSRETVVPSLLRSEPQAALKHLREIGLVPAVESQEVDDEGLAGVICAQHPDAGIKLPYGGVVLLLVGQISVAEESSPAAEPEPIEEDDWFDIELPGVDHSFRDSPSDGPEDRDARLEAATSHAARSLPARSDKPAGSHRPRRRVVVAAAIALAVMALLAVTVRSCGERQTAAPSPETSAQHERPATGQMPKHRPQPLVRPAESTRERQRPSQHRMARRHAAPVPPVPPTRIRSVPEPPRVLAPARSVPDSCEFCPERLSP